MANAQDVSEMNPQQQRGNLKEYFISSNLTLSSFALLGILRTCCNLVVFKNRNVK